MPRPDQDETSSTDIRLHGQKPALEVVCLGSGGGPSEENATAFLVRSVSSNWAKGSLLAVDAGSHLAAITKILERDFPVVAAVGGKERRANNGSNGHGRFESLSQDEDEDEPQIPEPTTLTSGPFVGLTLPNASARANAAHILRSYISTYLITHPHLDHLSGFAINTAALHGGSRPKTLAALPSTVEAVKRHIFNDVIWPNLTDEDGGVGFVTFQRLKEGGDIMVGEGPGRGYIDVCDGLGVKAFKVSHGCSTKGPPVHVHHRGSISNISDTIPAHMLDNGRTFSQFSNPGTPTPRMSFHPNNAQATSAANLGPQLSPSLQAYDTSGCVVESTAFFLRDSASSREVLIFGDVEPDSLSYAPRTYQVWAEAAPKVAAGVLAGIFIECSYDDSQADAVLFGHLAPRHLVAELQTLAGMVGDAGAQRDRDGEALRRKRKRGSGLNGADADRKRSRSLAGRSVSQAARRSSVPAVTGLSDSAPTSSAPQHRLPPHALSCDAAARRESSGDTPEPLSPNSVSFPGSAAGGAQPLKGVRVVVIHVKDTLKDGPHASERILHQLTGHEAELRDKGIGLGCEFVVSAMGESYWF